MGTESEALRRQVAALGRRMRGARLPEELRSEIARYASIERRRGAGVREIAGSVGVSPESIRRWTTSRTSIPRPTRTTSRALVPVVVREDRDDSDSRGVSLTAPGGYRVDGLTVAAAAELLRRLA